MALCVNPPRGQPNQRKLSASDFEVAGSKRNWKTAVKYNGTHNHRRRAQHTERWRRQTGSRPEQVQAASRAVAGSRSLDLEELHVEDERAVRRDAGNGPAAVGKVGGDGQAALTTDRHAENTDVPALDDLALADLEGERRALLVGYAVSVSFGPTPIPCSCGNLQSNTLPFWSLPM